MLRGGSESGGEIRRFIVIAVIVRGAVKDLAGCAAPKKKGAGDKVGGVEARDGQGHYILVNGGRTDVDESKETRDDSYNGDGDHGIGV